jgi:hypothetical protein
VALGGVERGAAHTRASVSSRRRREFSRARGWVALGDTRAPQPNVRLWAASAAVGAGECALPLTPPRSGYGLHSCERGWAGVG